jgi:hypothetical protein
VSLADDLNGHGSAVTAPSGSVAGDG